VEDQGSKGSSDNGTPAARRARKAWNPTWVVRLPNHLIEEIMKRMRWIAALLAGTLSLAACTGLQAAAPDIESLDVTMASAPGSTEAPLLAGQNRQVGVVTVTEDQDQDGVCVTYALDVEAVAEGWRIHATHLFVGADTAGIPINRSGNPVPGRFPYGEGDLGGVKEWSDCVAANEVGELVIAAHAAIRLHANVSFDAELAWLRSSEIAVTGVPSLQANWQPSVGFGIALDPLQTAWDPITRRAYWNHFNAGSPLATRTDLRRFQATFDLPVGYEVLGSVIASVEVADKFPINDNLYVFMNEALQFWGGTNTGGKTFEGKAGIAALRPVGGAFGTDGWYIPRSILTQISPNVFSTGPNVLDLFTEEFASWGGMHELELTLDVLDLNDATAHETVWGAGLGITDRGNWGTYFTHTSSDD
jgi:hypothetical protein